MIQQKYDHKGPNNWQFLGDPAEVGEAEPLKGQERPNTWQFLGDPAKVGEAEPLKVQ
jgi:hypothetical protein